MISARAKAPASITLVPSKATSAPADGEITTYPQEAIRSDM